MEWRKAAERLQPPNRRNQFLQKPEFQKTMLLEKLPRKLLEALIIYILKKSKNRPYHSLSPWFRNRA